MVTVSVRELKNHLSHYLACAEQGEQVTITRRGKIVGILLSPEKAPSPKKTIEELAEEGFVLWKGGKPKGASRSIRLPGKPLSQYIIEGRG